MLLKGGTTLIAQLSWVIYLTDVMITMQYWGDVSVNEQKDREIIKNIMLWNDDISEDWDKNRIETQCVWWCYCKREMLHIM